MSNKRKVLFFLKISCAPAVGGQAAPDPRTILIAFTGQRTAHRAQPVQSSAPCNTACLGPQLAAPCVCKDSTCGGHTLTHQPQPVHRVVLMAGNALGGSVMAGGAQGTTSLAKTTGCGAMRVRPCAALYLRRGLSFAPSAPPWSPLLLPSAVWR